MVQDVRRIMLTPEELVSAYEGYRRITPGFLPKGTVIGCIPKDESVSVTLQIEGSKICSEHIVTGIDAVRPLIRFCLENNIMLPKNGQKTLFTKDGTASLYIVLNFSTNIPQYIPLASTVAKQHALNTRDFSPADIMNS